MKPSAFLLDTDVSEFQRVRGLSVYQIPDFPA